MSDFDVARLRQDTPACRDLVHFNNAGAALMPRPGVDAVVGHLCYEEPFGGYKAALELSEHFVRDFPRERILLDPLR